MSYQFTFVKVAEGWVGIVDGKLLCVANGAKFLCVVDVSSWHLSYQHSKNLSHQLMQWPSLMLKGLAR
jgi:hypothetical protein